MPDPINDPRNPGKSATDARQGHTTGVVRWVLAISVILAILGMIGSYVWR